MSDWKVLSMAVVGLGGPDVANSFLNNFSSVIEVFVRLGQVGVAVVTILYIYRKWRNAKK